MNDIDTKKLNQYTYKVRQAFPAVLMTVISIFLIFVIINIILVYLIGSLNGLFLFGVSISTINFVITILLQLTNLYLIASLVLNWKSSIYTFKPHELIHETGVLSRREKRYDLSQMETITVRQSFVAKLFNFGTLKIYSPLLKEDLYISQIPDPDKYRSILLRPSELKEKEITYLPDRPDTPLEEREILNENG